MTSCVMIPFASAMRKRVSSSSAAKLSAIDTTTAPYITMPR